MERQAAASEHARSTHCHVHRVHSCSAWAWVCSCMSGCACVATCKGKAGPYLQPCCAACQCSRTQPMTWARLLLLRDALSHSYAHMLTNMWVGFMESGRDATASTADAATCFGGALLEVGTAERGRCMADRHARNLLQDFDVLAGKRAVSRQCRTNRRRPIQTSHPSPALNCQRATYAVAESAGRCSAPGGRIAASLYFVVPER